MNLGEFEYVVLLALARVAEPAHGARLHAEIVDVTDRDVSIPAVYVTLSRMEQKGLVRVKDARTGARVRKLYAITASGGRALRETRATFDRLWADVDLAGLPGGRS